MYLLARRKDAKAAALTLVLIRNRAQRNAAIDKTFEVCTGLGVLGGLLWKLNQPIAETPPPKPCHAADCVTDSVSAAVNSTLWSWAVPVGIGALIGLALAVLIVFVFLRRPRTPSTISGDRRRFRPDTRWMNARYAGRCSACRSEIRPGDTILHSKSPRATWCAACGER